MCHVEQWPLDSNGQSYIAASKAACPGAYTWQFDDVAALHTCGAANYDVNFC